MSIELQKTIQQTDKGVVASLEVAKAQGQYHLEGGQGSSHKGAHKRFGVRSKSGAGEVIDSHVSKTFTGAANVHAQKHHGKKARANRVTGTTGMSGNFQSYVPAKTGGMTSIGEPFHVREEEEWRPRRDEIVSVEGVNGSSRFQVAQQASGQLREVYEGIWITGPQKGKRSAVSFDSMHPAK